MLIHDCHGTFIEWVSSQQKRLGSGSGSIPAFFFSPMIHCQFSKWPWTLYQFPRRPQKKVFRKDVYDIGTLDSQRGLIEALYEIITSDYQQE